ncbi:MAG: HAMP domain-containing protein [Pirellulales bacterium]|nr:HAMP domain-containing protein [Pirellulales bacterium]
MFGKWPIRVKMFVGLGLLVLVVAILFGAGLYTSNAYRDLVRALRARGDELPVAAELSRDVSEARITVGRLHGLRVGDPTMQQGTGTNVQRCHQEFRGQLIEVERVLARYRGALEDGIRAGTRIADNRGEHETVREMEIVLGRIRQFDRDPRWPVDSNKVAHLEKELLRLQNLADHLPSFLHEKLGTLVPKVRPRYRTSIVGTWVAGASAVLILVLFVRLFYQWIFSPLNVLIGGSRRVASGEFEHRIALETDDEMGELAGAMNDMTARFRAIRDDLDHQVQERTRQVVRSEQLASVGFLAAGVAHEINNPLASIALCSESLESRVRGLLVEGSEEHEVISNYLGMIQSEAFRCKEITEKLLDFSRAGQARRQSADLGELVEGVIEMIGHLGKYQHKHIEFSAATTVIAPVQAQEIKQVVLNVLTNALDSVDDGGTVRVRLSRTEDAAELVFEDNGCGMEPDVLQHVFEPFFTRRRSGQGTGLGLSISYRIIAEHGGEIRAESPGAGQGATFRIRLPLATTHKEVQDRYQAA